jgi:hypothetical protein
MGAADECLRVSGTGQLNQLAFYDRYARNSARGWWFWSLYQTTLPTTHRSSNRFELELTLNFRFGPRLKRPRPEWSLSRVA